MEFCDSCYNLYTSRVIDDPKNTNKKLIEYYCKFCSQSKIRDNNEPLYVHNYGSISKIGINSNTPFDNTLPRMKTIICPNDECPSHELKNNNVLMVLTNEVELKHVYICQYCKYTWKV